MKSFVFTGNVLFNQKNWFYRGKTGQKKNILIAQKPIRLEIYKQI